MARSILDRRRVATRRQTSGLKGALMFSEPDHLPPLERRENDRMAAPLDGRTYCLHVNAGAVDDAFVNRVLREVRSRRMCAFTIEVDSPKEMEECVEGGALLDLVLDEVLAGSTAVIFLHTTQHEIEDALSRIL